MKNRPNYCFVLMVVLCATHGYCREVDVNYLTRIRLATPPISADALPFSEQHYSLDEIIATAKKLDTNEWIYGPLLMRLKDQSTITKYAKRYVESNGTDRIAYRAIADSKSPWMIPEIIEVLITGMPVTDYLGDDQIRLGPAGDTRILITTMLASSPEFSNEVRSWARGHLSKRDIGRQNELIAALRNWWTINEPYFRAESFDKVQVPASIPSKQPALATIQPTPESVAPPPPEAASEPVRSSVAASMPTPAAEPAPIAKTNLVWWIVGLIILAAGAVFVARKKKPRA